MRKCILPCFIFTSLLLSCSSTNDVRPHIIIETAFGDMEFELYADKAPQTVAAFLKNVEAEIYSSSSFYRVLNDDNQPSNAAKTNLIQGGIWNKKNKKPVAENIPHEPTQLTGITHLNGTLSMARTTPGSASSEFFICIGDQPGLDFGGENNADGQGYAAFGKLVKGQSVLLKIYRQEEFNQQFTPPVHIFSIKLK